MTITYFGSASNPADQGTGTGEILAVTPPSSMTAGDLVIFHGQNRDIGYGAPLAISETGGQTWYSFDQLQSIAPNPLVAARIFWCVFNGTWSADPSIDGSTATMSVVMHVFRPTNQGYIWAVDVQQSSGIFPAPTVGSPDTTITGITTLSASTVSIAGWFTDDANNWGDPSGGSWLQLGTQEYRNLDTGGAQCHTWAYVIKSSAGSTGDVTKTQSSLNRDDGWYCIFAFSEQLRTVKVLGKTKILGSVKIL